MNKMFFILIIITIMLSGCISQQKSINTNEPTLNEQQQTQETVETIPSNNPPQAQFTYTNELYTVTFIDQSNDLDNDPLTYQWDFGDGATSIETNPVHTFDVSDTNLFDVSLVVTDGKDTDTYTGAVLFQTDLEILYYEGHWYYDEESEDYMGNFTNYLGDISVKVTNNGNIPAEITHGKLDTKQRGTDTRYPLYSCDVYFDYTYTYEKTISGDSSDGLSQEIVITVLSDNTQRLNPGESIILHSNPDLTTLYWPPGSYDAEFWLMETRNNKMFSHTMVETIIDVQ